MNEYLRAALLILIVGVLSAATWVMADDSSPCIHKVNVTEENYQTVGPLLRLGLNGDPDFYGAIFGEQYALPPDHPDYWAYRQGTPVALVGCE